MPFNRNYFQNIYLRKKQMEERDRLVKTRFPAEIADIQRDRCSQCDKRSTHFELCRDHHNLCLFCCDNTARIIQDDEENVPTYLVCQACEALYGSSWLKYTEHSLLRFGFN